METERRTPCILTAYYKPKPGGLCTRYFRAIHALLSRGCTVHYLAVEAFPIDHPRCHFHRLPWLAGRPTRGLVFWAWLHVAGCVALTWLALRYKPSHAFTFSINYGAMMMPALVFRPLDYSVFLRADSVLNNRIKGGGPALARLEIVLEAIAIWRARLVCVSSALESQVLGRHRVMRPATCVVLRNDVPSSVERREPQEDSDCVHLAFAGVLEPRKNPWQIIELAARTTDLSIRWTMYGEGPLMDRLKTHARAQGVSSRIAFPGWIDLSTQWTDIHILVHPAVHEGAPNSVVEALGHGRPVLASNLPEIREILPEDMCCDNNDADQWEQAVRWFVSDPDFRKHLRCEASAAAAKLRFDWDAAVVKAVLGERSERVSRT